MATCCLLIGLVFVAIAFAASTVSYVVPYWRDNKLDGYNEGLWAQCVYGQSCKWPWDNQAGWLKTKSELVWHYITQGLMGVGLIFLGLAFIGACVSLCTACCRSGYRCVSAVSTMLIFAFSLNAAAIILWGVYANKTYGTQVSSGHDLYMWGYWVGVGGVGVNFIAILFYTIECCRGYTHDGD